MRRSITSLSLSLLAATALACGSAQPSVTPITGPAGQAGWLDIRCPHARAKCRELAADACPRGYDVMDPRGNQDRYTAPDTMSEPMGRPGDNGEMVVACK